MEIIIVAPSHVPLVIGGAERLWWGLLEHLNRNTPHVADIVKLPGHERTFAEVLDSYRRFSELDLRDYELVISSKYPGWMTAHPNHVCYMLHPLRGLYDTYPDQLAPECTLTHPSLRGLLNLVRGDELSREALHECFERVGRLQSPRRLRRPVPVEAFAFPGPLIREIVHFCDRVAFAPGAVRRFSAISEVVARRPGYFPAHADVIPVHPPSNLAGYRSPRPGRFFFTVSRLDAPKRIDLLIEAARRLGPDVELQIAGTGPDEPRLRELANGDPRLRFLGFVNDDQLLDLYAEAIAVLFVPYQEDFGLVALEAMQAGKPVITALDAGGASELVSDGETGLVVEPTAEAIAQAMHQLQARPEWAAELGRRAQRAAQQVNWQEVCRVLLNGLGS